MAIPTLGHNRRMVTNAYSKGGKLIEDPQPFAYYAVFRAARELRPLSAEEKAEAAHEAEILLKEREEEVHIRRIYSTVAFRPDADLMMWWVAYSADEVQSLLAAFRRYELGQRLNQTWSFMGLYRPPGGSQGPPAGRHPRRVSQEVPDGLSIRTHPRMVPVTCGGTSRAATGDGA
jgi:chlorite dismutase